MVPNLQLEAEQEKKAALEKENRDLRSALSRLESKLQSKERVYIYAIQYAASMINDKIFYDIHLF
jgi:hypothetical protein